jgi:hypothetical protein
MFPAFFLPTVRNLIEVPFPEKSPNSPEERSLFSKNRDLNQSTKEELFAVNNALVRTGNHTALELFMRARCNRIGKISCKTERNVAVSLPARRTDP